MTREEAKEILPIIQAFSEGKKIEGIYKGIKEPWFNVENMVFDGGTKYRIKSSPTYRPFANAEECWNEMLKHQPFGWVKTNGNKYRTIDSITSELHVAYQGKGYTFEEAFDTYTFADGAPFGVKVEDD